MHYHSGKWILICLSLWNSLKSQTVSMQAALGHDRDTDPTEGPSERKEPFLRQQAPLHLCSGFASKCYWARQRAEITGLGSWCELHANLLLVLLVSRRGNQQLLVPAAQPWGVWRWHQTMNVHSAGMWSGLQSSSDPVAKFKQTLLAVYYIQFWLFRNKVATLL